MSDTPRVITERRVSDERVDATLKQCARATITGEYSEEHIEARLVRDICADLRDARAELSAVDNLLSRRDALDDLKDRCDKIARLLRVANEKDPKGIIPESERDKAALTALREQNARLVGAIEFYLREYPCPGGGLGIHSVFNQPGRCPEESDDPNEWCMSAKFRVALGIERKPCVEGM